MKNPNRNRTVTRPTLTEILQAMPHGVIGALRARGICSASKIVELVLFIYASLPTTPRCFMLFTGADENRYLLEFCERYVGKDGSMNWKLIGGAQ